MNPFRQDMRYGLRMLLINLGVAAQPGVEFERGHARRGQGKSRLHSVLVTAQVAVCLVLMIGAGLCLRSLVNAQSRG